MQGMPRLGQGTWHMGERAAQWKEEIDALRAGIDAGMTMIDTAEMYGEGRAESLVGEAIRGLDRDGLYLVSKVYPHNAGGRRLVQCCEASLRRMGVETLDLYLLHWRGGIPLAETVEGMEGLARAGKIRRWGVSNLGTADMDELLAVPGGGRCATNQVLYHLGSRGVEFDLLPWLREHSMPMMAYCPLAQGGSLRRGLAEHPAVRGIASQRDLTPMQVLLGFVMAQPGAVPIPKAATAAHARENAAMLDTVLTPAEVAALSAAFPAPGRKVPLDIE